jgi:hypothetical protein
MIAGEQRTPEKAVYMELKIAIPPLWEEKLNKSQIARKNREVR